MKTYAKLLALFVVILGAWGMAGSLLYYIAFEQSSIYLLLLIFSVPGTILAGYAYLKSRSVPLSHFGIWAVGAVLIWMGSIISGVFSQDLSLRSLGGWAITWGVLGAAIALNYHVMRKEGKSG
jgi:hypothetical protein